MGGESHIIQRETSLFTEMTLSPPSKQAHPCKTDPGEPGHANPAQQCLPRARTLVGFFLEQVWIGVPIVHAKPRCLPGLCPHCKEGTSVWKDEPVLGPAGWGQARTVRHSKQAALLGGAEEVKHKPDLVALTCAKTSNKDPAPDCSHAPPTILAGTNQQNRFISALHPSQWPPLLVTPFAFDVAILVGRANRLRITPCCYENHFYGLLCG